MIRSILLHGLVFLAPISIYIGWALWVRRRSAQEFVETGHDWNDAPWTWLLIAGSVLMVASLFAVAFVGRSDPQAEYVPPHYEDGQIVPSHVRPPDATDH